MSNDGLDRTSRFRNKNEMREKCIKFFVRVPRALVVAIPVPNGLYLRRKDVRVQMCRKKRKRIPIETKSCRDSTKRS